MKPYKKSRIARTTTCRKTYKVVTNEMYSDPYWEDYYMRYPRIHRGFKNPHKTLLAYQMRAYRTWKYNRKTQWKEK